MAPSRGVQRSPAGRLVVVSGAGSDSLSLSRTLELGGCFLISVNLDYPVE